MNDSILTVLFFIVSALLFVARYILPLFISVVGISFVRKERKNLGISLIIIGILVEITSILLQVMSFK